MNTLIPFQFENKNLRVITDEHGDPWFVAADLCKVIGLADHKGSYKHHLDKLDDDERASIPRSLVQGTPTLNMGVVAKAFVDAAGGATWAEPEIWTVSESGAYALILRSRDATTPGTVHHRFRKWITSEVLPTIRKTGAYVPPQQTARLPQLQPVRDLLLVGKAMAKVKGVNEALAMACTLDAIERTTGLPTTMLARALPAVAPESAATLNATQVGEPLSLNGRSANAILEKMGLQYRDENKDWKLTDAGTAYGEMKPFHRNGHSGYETRWKPSVIEVLRNYLDTIAKSA